MTRSLCYFTPKRLRGCPKLTHLTINSAVTGHCHGEGGFSGFVAQRGLIVNPPYYSIKVLVNIILLINYVIVENQYNAH